MQGSWLGYLKTRHGARRKIWTEKSTMNVIYAVKTWKLGFSDATVLLIKLNLDPLFGVMIMVNIIWYRGLDASQ